MTNRYFTKQAIGDARSLGVQLWDRNKLKNLIAFADNGKDSEAKSDEPSSKAIKEKIYRIEDGNIQITLNENNEISILIIDVQDVIELACIFFYLYIELRDNYKEIYNYKISTVYHGKTINCENEYVYGENYDGTISRTTPDWLEKARRDLVEIGTENYQSTISRISDIFDDFMNGKKESYSDEYVKNYAKESEKQFIDSYESEENIISEEKKEECKSKESADKIVPYNFPPLSLLRKGDKEEISNETLRDYASQIEKVLFSFGIRVTVINYTVGLNTIKFELQPEFGTSVREITSLSDDLKLGLAVNDIKIEAPIPGKAAIGITIPTRKRRDVYIREIIESKEFLRYPSNLLLVVGIDEVNKVVLSDIAKMPNLLISGTTGSGKSVFLDSMIIGIIYKAHPMDVKLMLIDTKCSNFNIYNGVPHLLLPVITNAQKASAALHWAIAESVNRYKKFSEYNVKTLKEYNIKTNERLPQILIVVDDISDLMLTNKEEVEESIVRLAEMSRAVGIHLIISTQRPSADIITGRIKANMPSRIAFKVFSTVDSRVILDEKGAEELSGCGDMLFKPIGYPKPVHIQGAYVSNEEISHVVDFIKNNCSSDIILPNDKEEKKEIEQEEKVFDEYFADAGRFIIEKDKASIGMLQRFFKIGFNRAARIMDELSEAGVVGEEEGTKSRRILMTLEEFERYIKNNS